MDRVELEKWIADRFGSQPDHPFSKYPDYAVFRHADTRRWFVLVMDVGLRRIGVDSEDTACLVNVKCDPDDGVFLRYAEDILPAYHMNKKHWISIRLDGSLPRETVFHLVEQSFELTR